MQPQFSLSLASWQATVSYFGIQWHVHMRPCTSRSMLAGVAEEYHFSALLGLVAPFLEFTPCGERNLVIFGCLAHVRVHHGVKFGQTFVA